MKVKTALILCAGLGKRLKPLTLEQPKPLLKLNNITLLENTINLIKELGMKKIILNTFYLKNQIADFISEKKFNISIDIIEDGIAGFVCSCYRGLWRRTSVGIRLVLV